jgi:hypothetical protein
MSELHALLIGLDVYLPNLVPGVGHFPHLKGSVRDVTRVEEFLRRCLQVPVERISKLTATENGSDEPAEPREQWPTYENMVAAFQQLTDAASSGDQVYIHYSGHGARAKTTLQDIKGPGRWDEALVPIDIGNSEARYLRDFELARLLKGMVDKGLFVTLVLDSCHAGGATRGENPNDAKVAVPRGLPGIDISDRRTDSLAGSPEELRASWSSSGTTRQAQAFTDWLPKAEGYVMIAACSPQQPAFEYPFEGSVSSGVLTHWLLDGLQQLRPDLTYQALFDRINAKTKSQFQQTPVLVGEKNRVVFGVDRAVRRNSVLVLSVEGAGRQVRINAGQAHGVSPGTQFALYRPEADFTRAEERLGVVEVLQDEATECLAEIVGDDPSREGLEPGCSAVLLDSGSNQLRKSAIRLVYQSSPPTPIEEQALGAVAALLEGTESQVHIAGDGETADFLVAINEQQEIEIQEALGTPVLNLGPPLLAKSPTAASTIVARLSHLARYHFVRKLDNVDVKRPSIDVELLGIEDGYDSSKRPNPQSGTGGSTVDMKLGQWTFLRIINRDSRVLNVVVLDLQPDWGITQICPGTNEESLLPLDPGEVFDLPLQGQLPAGLNQGTDVLKVFATVGATDFRWLELPALLEEQVPASASRGSSEGEERSMMTVASTRARYIGSSTPPSQEWTTAQVQVRIERSTARVERSATPVTRDGSAVGRSWR